MNDKSQNSILSGENNHSTPNQRLSSKALFGQKDRIEIEHRGEVYRLQITRQGKLILTK